MTDTAMHQQAIGAPRRLDVSSDAAKARIRARYRAETRFRIYGMLALGFTALFLAALIFDVVKRALPAFVEHVVELEVPLPADALAAGGKVDAASIRAADYFPIVKEALDRAIPGIEGRSAQKQLSRLISSGAGDAVRDRLLADQSLVGGSIKVPLLLSADADLYYKGYGTDVVTRAARGIATPSGTTGEITVLTGANDFADELVAIKGELRGRIAQLDAEAAGLSRSKDKAAIARAEEAKAEAAELRKRVEEPGIEETLDSKMPSLLVELNGGLVKASAITGSSLKGEVLLPLKTADEAAPGQWRIVTYSTPESNRKISDQEAAFLERFRSIGAVRSGFNTRFFMSGDSREPELAGIRGALTGSALTLFVTLLLCLPVGVAAAVYLEEFAPKNRLTDIVEVNINNLAAVPSIVFGLLGLAVFLSFFDMPRSAPIVGGLVLALLVLPTIIISARAALRSVPPSIKEAALGVGASHQQAIFHHVLPLAMPGIMTGTIIGMAHALGETAPLLMIGMVAFIVDIPTSFTQAATVMPVQIYLWSDLPEISFQSKTAAAIVVLLLFLFTMNGAAIWLRKKFERRW